MNNYDKYMARKERIWGWASALFFGVVVLVLLGIDFYESTIIDPLILVGIVAIGTALAMVLLWKKLRLAMGFLSAAFLCASIGGGFFFYLFLLLNKSFTSGTNITKQFPIVEASVFKRRSYSCGRPHIVIDFHGQEKKFVFKCDDLEYPIENYTAVRLQYRKGLFGFAYVEKQELIVNPD